MGPTATCNSPCLGADRKAHYDIDDHFGAALVDLAGHANLAAGQGPRHGLHAGRLMHYDEHAFDEALVHMRGQAARAMDVATDGNYEAQQEDGFTC